MSVCCFTPSQFADMDEALLTSQLPVAVVEQLREDAGEMARPDTAAALAQSWVTLGGAATSGPQQPWLSAVAQHRDTFAGAAFAVTNAYGRHLYMFMFALQRPLVVRFSPLSLDDAGMEPLHVDSTNWEDICLDRPCLHAFRAHYGASVGSDQLPSQELEHIEVLFGLRHLGADRVSSNGAWEPLAAVLARLPVKATCARSRSTPATSRAHKDTLLQEFPWLEGTLDPQEPKQQQGGQSSQASCLDPALLDDAAVDDADIDEALDALRQKREAVGMAQVLPPEFRVQLVASGGFRSGGDLEAFRGEVRQGTAAERWLALYGLQKSSTYQTSRFGQRGAQLCAETWCAVMQHLLDIWLAQPVDGYVYTEEDLRTSPGNPELALLLPTLPAAAQSRAQALLRVAAPRYALSSSSRG